MRRQAFLVAALILAAGTGCKKDAPPAPAPAAPVQAPAPAPAAKPRGEVASRVEVVVDESGFVPSRIPAKAGKPITLAITRKIEKTCATEILFKGQEGKTPLPLNKTVEVTYTPKASGEIAFGCAMGMMVGGTLDVAD
jgi:hypothetical protein